MRKAICDRPGGSIGSVPVVLVSAISGFCEIILELWLSGGADGAEVDLVSKW